MQPENLLIHANCMLQLSDFNLAVEGHNWMKGFRGTVSAMAPCAPGATRTLLIPVETLGVGSVRFSRDSRVAQLPAQGFT